MEKQKIEWTEMKNSRGLGHNTLTAEIEGFQVKVSWDYDPHYEFDHYGEFCEERDIGRNDFALRNPNCWTKRDEGNGTDSWVRVSTREFGWFKLTNHPKDEVKWLMENENMPEREAWQKVLDRERQTLRKLIRDEIFGIFVSVRVYREGVELGHDAIGGNEIEGYVKIEDVIDIAEGNGLVENAIKEAKQTLKDLCTCH